MQGKEKEQGKEKKKEDAPTAFLFPPFFIFIIYFSHFFWLKKILFLPPLFATGLWVSKKQKARLFPLSLGDVRDRTCVCELEGGGGAKRERYGGVKEGQQLFVPSAVTLLAT